MEQPPHALTPEQITSIINAVIDPETTFRKHAARGLVREFHKRFGDLGLLDLLIALDNTDRFASMIVLERNELENTLFERHGVFDEDIITKVQFTDVWEDFIHNTIHQSGIAAQAAIDEIIQTENT
jgi:hypothetical protein